MDIKEKIGKRIREIRESKKISQEKLAELADLDRTYISSVEKGKRNISIENIEKITKALDHTLQDFFSSEIFNHKQKK